MERNQMVEMIMSKLSVRREVATDALERSNWDVVDAILYLERKEKGESSDLVIIDVKAKEEKKSNEESFGGVGEIVGRMFKFAGRTLKKANSSYFEIRKENKKPIRMTLTMLALALIFLSIPSIVLLLIGLFAGYKYSISGFSSNYDGVNDIFEGVSKTASDIKKDFKEGYAK